MNPSIRHRRLHAFYQSKVLNILMMIIIVSLLLMAYSYSMLLPVICSSIALACFIAYSAWLWGKKPASIVINNRLSGIGSFYVLYYLIVVAIDADNQWWYIIPVAVAVIVLFLSSMNYGDEEFTI